MQKLPDFEGLAIFAKVAEARAFSRAATDLGVSKATVSKAVTRLEERLGTRLFHRTSRHLSLTESGRTLLIRANRVLGEAEAAESEALDRSSAPRGLVRLAVPMSFGLAYVTPVLPQFLAANPGISIDVHLSDQIVDLIGDGFDLALRIAALADSSLVARRLCPVRVWLVGAPSYFAKHGRPTHPRELSTHQALTYAYVKNPETWRFVSPKGEEVAVKPLSRFRANNADALTPALLAGEGLAMQPDFTVAAHLRAGTLEAILTEWAPPPIAVHLVMPPGGLRPARVGAVIDFLAAHFATAPWTVENLKPAERKRQKR
ncbi:HTH-type transcriptional regulator DmlR [Alphaproteobacteria bacterium SO-S41]|nr:HTH-type transcriptional regulator DmlR [Alphaproteobacteria bacterium SO-S41]